jgi:hypothetical protein
MKLAEDTRGLHVEADLDPANPQVQALRSAMDRKDIDEMSFAFWVTRQCWSPDYDQRDILEVNLNKGDVSAVNYGANPNTAGAQMNARQLAAQLQHMPAEERKRVFDRLAEEFQEPVLLTDRSQAAAWLKDRFTEIRAGKQLSGATMDTLQSVLDLVAAADDAVDEAQVQLSGLMGVPNPDDDADDGDEGSEGAGSGTDSAPDPQANSLDLYDLRRRLLAI